MFSGGKDGRVVVWYVHTWVPICKIETNTKVDTKDMGSLEIDQLVVSNDNTILLAMANTGIYRVRYWEIQSNAVTLSLNLTAHQGNRTYKAGLITPDEEYMLLVDDTNKSLLWNLFDRCKEDSLDLEYTVDHQCIGCSSFKAV